MPARSKRSLAQLGKHGAKKLKVHHPDEAPAPATKRCRYGWPAPVAADAPPPSAHGPVRYARPPDLYEIVCALTPTELMYHLYEMPAELAILSLPDLCTGFYSLFVDHGASVFFWHLCKLESNIFFLQRLQMH